MTARLAGAYARVRARATSASARVRVDPRCRPAPDVILRGVGGSSGFGGRIAPQPPLRHIPGDPMLKRNLVSLGALGVFAVLAAGSTPDVMDEISAAGAGGAAGGGGDNAAACRDYVAHYNSLSCVQSVGIEFEADDMCPDALDLNPNDMSGYYQCMIDNSKCNGDIPDMAGAVDCEMPF